MSYYVIIRGPLGVGKSTVAKKLIQRLKGEYVSVDDVLQENGLDKVTGSGGIPLSSFITAVDVVLPEVKKKLEQGRSVVFDGCFYYKAQIEHLVGSLSYPHHIFTLKAPVETCIARDSKRPNSYGKDAATAVHGLVSQFDYGTVIDTTQLSEDETVEAIARDIRE